LLLTDVDTYKTSKSVFRQPAIVFDVAPAGIDMTLSTEQEKELNIVKGRIIVGNKPVNKAPVEPKPIKENVIDWDEIINYENELDELQEFNEEITILDDL